MLCQRPNHPFHYDRTDKDSSPTDAMAATSAAQAQQNNPFIKQLAANDRKTRDRAITSLRTYLSRNTPFTPLDLLKLHKGLFYSMWSADKPKYQQALARDLASLTTVFSTDANTLLYIRTFWETIAREWTGIEALRMDKFLYLVRQMLHAGFALLQKNQWADASVREQFLDIVAEIPLAPREPKVPNGLRYHVIDIYVDELQKVDTDRTAPLQELLSPLKKLAKDGMTKSVRKRADEALDDERLVDWKGENVDVDASDEEVMEDAESGAEEEDDEFGGFDD